MCTFNRFLLLAPRVGICHPSPTRLQFMEVSRLCGSHFLGLQKVNLTTSISQSLASRALSSGLGLMVSSGCWNLLPAWSVVGPSHCCTQTSDPLLEQLLNNLALRLCREPELSRMGLSFLEVCSLVGERMVICQGRHGSQQNQHPQLQQPREPPL